MLSKSNLLFLSICIFPLLFVKIAGFFIIPTQEDFIREVCNFMLNTAIAVSILGILPNAKLRNVFAFLFAVLLGFLVFIKLSFYHIYSVKLSASALFVIFETNTGEASSYLSAYVSGILIFLLSISILYWFFTWQFLFRKKYSFQFSDFSIWLRLSIKAVMFLLLVVSLYAIPWKFSDYNILYKTKSSYEEYQVTKSLIKQDLAKPKTNVFKNVKLAENAPETAVVIIGESTTSTHMGLYGYYRNTNPKLSSIKNELLVFEDVIAPHVHTITALNEIMTLASSTNDSPDENASIIQLANAAGYETYWISNQRPVGVFESIPTLIGYGADHKFFLNTNDYNRQSYDEVLLPKLNEVLKKTGQKKRMIFLHLMGTHIGYAERYPKRFNYFKGEPKTPFQYKRAYQFINEYDNSIRYNDSIVFDVIQQIKNLNNSSYVLYFSDHGDDVFEVHETAGHSEYKATYPMYEVPFLLWTSKKYKQTQPFRFNTSLTKRPYMLDEFIYSFAELSGIRFKTFQSQKSIFNDSFQIQKEEYSIMSGMKKFLKNKYVISIGLFLVLLAVAYRYSSKRVELFGHYNKVWAHRVNDVKKLKSAQDSFAGMELDLVFLPGENDFDIYHPPSPSTGFYFSEFLVELKHKEKPLWLDIKNLNQANASSILKSLQSLLEKNNMYAFREQIIVESTDAFSLPIFRQAGFRTSFYIVEIINDANKNSIAQKISRKLKKLPVQIELSSNYHNYEYLQEAFPQRTKNFWVLTTTYDWETLKNLRKIRRMLNDTHVKTVLIPYINFNRYF